MQKQTVHFSRQSTDFYFDASLATLEQVAPKQSSILLVDENVWTHHHAALEGYKLIPLPAGEENKTMQTVSDTIEQLIKLDADRTTTLIGIGGGVATDITGFVASIYMRGVKFGFVPTSLLAMVDAAVGGKNGVDIGLYKNISGTVNHPHFLLYDYSLLETLPEPEWINGFAEIIKHACIKDAAMFAELKENSIDIYKYEPKMLAGLIQRNVNIKLSVVQRDEFESGERKLLNFGHTLGHAIENLYKLPHGHAVSIGMMAAASISEEINNFSSAEKKELSTLLQQYELPVSYPYDKKKTMEILKHDKKRISNSMNYILLHKIGEAVVKPVSLTQLEDLLTQGI